MKKKFVVDWGKVIRPAAQAEVVFANTTGDASTEDNRQNWKMRTLENNESNEYTATLKYNAAKEDPYRLKKKSVRGGSWKDPESYIRSAWRTWEYQNQPRSYIGFRCVRSVASSQSVKMKGKKSKN
jgi:hypothetical protein